MDSMDDTTETRARRNRSIYRRSVLATLGTGLLASLAGCSRSRVDGEVVTNETPLGISHEYATQATPSGTRVLVEVTIENTGSERITREERVPRITCRFLDEGGETLHEMGLILVKPLDVEESRTLEFTLAIDTEDVTRYELRSRWVEA